MNKVSVLERYTDLNNQYHLHNNTYYENMMDYLINQTRWVANSMTREELKELLTLRLNKELCYSDEYRIFKNEYIRRFPLGGLLFK